MNIATENHRDLKLPANAILGASAAVLALPFEIAREAYAKAVRSGLIQDSLLASARYSRDLSASEKLILGPWARSC